MNGWEFARLSGLASLSSCLLSALSLLGLLLARFGRGMGYGPIRTLSGIGMLLAGAAFGLAAFFYLRAACLTPARPYLRRAEGLLFVAGGGGALLFVCTLIFFL